MKLCTFPTNYQYVRSNDGALNHINKLVRASRSQVFGEDERVEAAAYRFDYSQSAGAEYNLVRLNLDPDLPVAHRREIPIGVHTHFSTTIVHAYMEWVYTISRVNSKT